ncbi:IpaC/SipC family type III secretion system effector [Lelliottia sp. WAP21]|uniref:IpaC/SipC family type III secretion system effector n=1 Tax=Lelliottia sp. WAP21 TaxID=2877426 RepID=UPI001E5AEFA3|nr:IpaC/SipC family type III secretion system effector [Lelliottia sp. WAP21]
MNTTINNVLSLLNIPLSESATKSEKAEVKGIRISDSAIANDITEHLSGSFKGATNDIDMQSALISPEFQQLLNASNQVLETALTESGEATSISMVLPKSSQQASLICMLIELANQASIADIELSSTFGIMSETSSLNAAQAQKAQGLAIFAKSIVSSSITMAGTGYATHNSVKNYSATKSNINQNLRGMHGADLQIRQMQNSLSASKNEHLDLSDIASSSSTVKKADGSITEFQRHDRTVSAEHSAVAARNLDETISNRDAFNAAFLQGEARTRLTTGQIEAQRAIGTTGSTIADGTGTLAHNIEQKEETEERTESKVMDGAVEMSRQQAQKSQQLLSNMMNLLNDVRRTQADLVSSFANNLKA